MQETRPRYLPTAEVAKLIRAALKAAHPGVKFTVRSDSYAGGSSINVGWTDGPSNATVMPLLDRYAGADFDGMRDLKTYRDDVLLAGPDGDVEQVTFGVDFVFANRRISPEFTAKLEEIGRAIVDADEYASQIGFDSGRWMEAIPTPYGTFQGGDGGILVRYLSEHVDPAA